MRPRMLSRRFNGMYLTIKADPMNPDLSRFPVPKDPMVELVKGFKGLADLRNNQAVMGVEFVDPGTGDESLFLHLFDPKIIPVSRNICVKNPGAKEELLFRA